MTINGKVPGAGVCVVDGCDARCGSNLMCRRHWAAVPRDLQREVYAELRRWNAGTGNLFDLRQVQEQAADVVAEGGHAAT